MIYGKNYINGKFVDANRALHPLKVFPKVNPSTEEVMGFFPETDRKAVNEAVAVARNAQKEWRKLSRVKRGDYFHGLVGVLESQKTNIVNAISLETGKSLNESTAEFNEAVHMVQYTAAQGREPYGEFLSSEIAEKDIIAFRKPKGVVAVVCPWNFPFAIQFWTSAPALLEGNSVVFKPSEDSPWVGDIIAQLYHKAGFPNGVFNLIHGTGETGKALVESNIDHICFTGSVAVGQSIRRHCAETFHKSASCEMGSKSALIICNDASMELALQASVASAFKLSGQRCVSAGRLIVQRGIYEEFSRFVEEVKKIKVGDPFREPDSFLGPLVNKSQFDRVRAYNDKTIGRTNILLQGQTLEGKGYYLTPHVYQCEWKHAHERDENGSLTHPFLREEVFGPNCAIIPFDTIEEASHIYNDTIYGLSLSVITNNMSIVRYMRENCDFGMMYVNAGTIGSESFASFQGIKASGSGGGSAAGSFRATSHECTMTINYDKQITWAQGMK